MISMFDDTKIMKTRKRSSSMHTACWADHTLSNSRQMSVPWGEGPQVNKFGQVFSDCFQMSLAGAGLGLG